MRQAIKNERVITSQSERTLQYISEIKNNVQSISHRTSMESKGTFDTKLISWIPSCSIAILLRENFKGIVKIIIQSPSFELPPSDIRNRLSMVFEQQIHEKEFNYFKTQFEHAWNGKATRNCTQNDLSLNRYFSADGGAVT